MSKKTNKETIETLESMAYVARSTYLHTDSTEETRQASIAYALCQIALQLDRLATHLEEGQTAIIDPNRT